ncbi:MAG: DUF4294 domain-containing protein [Rikenellaceae bacterium]
MKQPISIILAILTTISSIGVSFAAVESAPTEEPELIEVTLKPIFVFKRGIDRRKYWRLVNSVKKVYPLAKVAQQKMDEMKYHLDSIDSKSERKDYIRKIYKEIKEEYTPILMKMSYTDGRVLIRLIDRETEYTAYEVLDEFKGRFTASLWQGVGKLFGHNLKDEYGSNIEDQMIEKIIRYYEAGLL